MSSIMPPALIASHIKKAATGSHNGMGQVSGEAELLASQTGEILAQAIDTGTGKKYKVGKSFTKWGQVKDISKGWAGRYLAQESSLVMINFSPVLVYRVNSWFSIGGGSILMAS
jgi:hypothetical protein